MSELFPSGVTARITCILMGFLVQRSVHADVAGVAAGVAVGRVVAGWVKELPGDLAALDVLLADPELLWPLVER